jgi:hypothetical protein
MAGLAQTLQQISRRTATLCYGCKERERECAKTLWGPCSRCTVPVGTVCCWCCWRRLQLASVDVLNGKEAVSSSVRLAAFGAGGQRFSLMMSGAAIGQSVWWPFCGLESAGIEVRFQKGWKFCLCQVSFVSVLFKIFCNVTPCSLEYSCHSFACLCVGNSHEPWRWRY